MKTKCWQIFSDLTFHDPKDVKPDKEVKEEEKKMNPRDTGKIFIPPAYLKNKAERKAFDCGRKSNRHENLFPGGRFGIFLMLFEMQLILNLSLLCLIALFAFEIPLIHNDGYWAEYILLVIIVVVFLICIIIMLPAIIAIYMLITNVSFTIIVKFFIDRTDERSQTNTKNDSKYTS